MTFLVFPLCLIGFIISAYFTAIYLDLYISPLNVLAKACRIDTHQCEKVLETKQSHLFGVGNFFLGLLYYLILMVLCIFSFPFYPLVVFTSWIVVVISLYLVFELYYILKMPCPLCYTSHLINFCIAILLSFL